jgi:Ca2+-binding EF-hand superfamily protein
MNIDVVTEAQIEDMIMKADSNGDGKWSFAELFRILGPVTLAGKLFKLYDTKDKKYFSFDETKCLLNDIYCEFNIENGLDESELDKVILGHDLNGDGNYTFDEVFLIVGPILDRENFFWDNGINVTGRKFTLAEIKNLAKEAYTEIDIKRKGFLRSAKIKQWVNWIYLKMGVGKITTKQLVNIMENSANPKGFADEWPFEELIKLIGPVALVKSLFKNHDGDKTGYLTLASVKVLLREVIHDLRKTKPEEGEVSKIITKTGDAQGRFSFDELYQIIAPMISKKHFSIQFVMPTKLELKKMTKRIFRTYDTDKSDYLTYEETAIMLRDTFEELNGDSDFLTSAQILNLTKMIDIDLDGKIVYDE